MIIAGVEIDISFAKEQTNNTPLTSFVRDGFDPGVSGTDVDGKVSIDDVIRRFGTPASTKQKALNGVDEFTLQYDGLLLTLVRNLEFDKKFWLLPDLTNHDYKLKYGLGIGQTKAAFLNILGLPNDPDAEAQILDYKDRYKDEGQPLSCTVVVGEHEQGLIVSIYFDATNIATRIIWGFPADYN